MPTIAPARCSRRTQVALNGATCAPSNAEPQLSGWPATAMLSLTANGAPPSGPSGTPPSVPSGAASAPPSAAKDTKALMRSFQPRA